MDLPSNIESEILDYLHLEFGEAKDVSCALKLSDLKYEGVYVVEGVSLHCWSFPSASNTTWATVEATGSSHSIGMIESPNSNVEVSYDYLYVEIWEEKASVFQFPLIHDNENQTSCIEEDFTYTFKSGSVLGVSIELLRSYIPYRFSVYITHDEKTIEMHGEIKGVLDYSINENVGVKVVVGGEKWL